MWASAGGGWVVVAGSGGSRLRASLSDGHGGSAGRLVTLDSENLVVVVGTQAIAMLATADIHVSWVMLTSCRIGTRQQRGWRK